MFGLGFGLGFVTTEQCLPVILILNMVYIVHPHNCSLYGLVSCIVWQLLLAHTLLRINIISCISCGGTVQDRKKPKTPCGPKAHRALPFEPTGGCVIPDPLLKDHSFTG